MRNPSVAAKPFRWAMGVVLVSLCLLGTFACSGPRHVSVSRGDVDTVQGVFDTDRPPRGVHSAFARLGPLRPVRTDARVPAWQEKSYPAVTASIPQIPNAKLLNDDELCATCHEAYVKYHRTNVHVNQSCESCHGPGSEHVRTRGKEPGMILSFKQMAPAERSEACLKCHEQNACTPGAKWRTSAHAHAGVSCTDCHQSHYTVPPGTPATQVAEATNVPQTIQRVALQQPKVSEAEMQAIRAASRALGAANPQTCTRCHQPQGNMLHAGYPHQIDGPAGFKCASCHDPHGNVTKEARTDMCLKCHQGHATEPWPSSRHAQAGLACVDCHNPHAGSPKLGAMQPQTCYRCHQEKADLERVAHPHQIGGVNGFTCQTCHNPHGNIQQETRADKCLECHKGYPTMAWHSSTHALQGVACADCHNPHPRADVPQLVDIQHTHVSRLKRLPMSVQQPGACYQCHPKIGAQFSLPSHHPLPEGKMVCTDCHDTHGAAEKNLREPTVNLVCYRCHAEKQGPFVWQHPPVEENCDICHNPHGTVANNLLQQPPTFLCLRCHSGHREFRRNPDRNVYIRQPFYTDCSICHAQIHGSDRPSATLTPRLTR